MTSSNCGSGITETCEREMTLIEELDYLLKCQSISDETHSRLIRKLKKEHDIYDECRIWQREADDRCTALEHDKRILEQIVLKLTYDKYEKNIIGC